MKNINTIIAALMALGGDGLHGVRINLGAWRHKELVASGITRRKAKPGRNHPAKGYDPITKVWIK